MAKRPTSRSTRRPKKTSAPGAAKAKTKAAAIQPGTRDTQEQPGEHLVPVVGIGASAGGLEAFTHLLEALPANTGMAFVLISHLSHTHKSMLTELLSKSTRMKVMEVRRKTRVQANHVYVITPDADLALSDGAITVRSAVGSRKPHMVIDHFFRSLAQHRKNQAIGVVLSGTGTDGTLGLAAIQAEGGITFAQDDKSAKFPDMPRSASAGIGAADFVLSPDGIAREIARLARHPYVARKHRPAGGAEVFTEPLEVRHQIFRVVRAATGVDFSEYKPATIDRRISRRMVVHKIGALPDYLKLLQSSPDEALALSHDLLINVTEFFRDPEAFAVLKKNVLSGIIKRRAGERPIRVWVPACANGEEAYSIAICLLEALGNFGASPSVQIFATDVSTTAIQRARAGVYPEGIAQNVSAERLRRFFVKTERGYEIGKPVRDLCVFSVQNVIKDPPFSRVDLISCRNLLIYLEPALQQRVLATFYYALNPFGYLFLGNSETVGASSDLFQQVTRKQRIYSKIQSAAPARFSLAHDSIAAQVLSQEKATTPRAREIPDVRKEAERLLIQQYGPPGFIVNPAMDIVEFCGQPSEFLAPAAGKASFNLFKMARQSLNVDLRTAIHQAKKRGAAVRKEDIRLGAGDDAKTINLAVIPLRGDKASEGHYLILFEDSARKEQRKGETPAGPSGKPAGQARENERLKAELASVQEHLHSIVEEQEATNEELQSANEEILSSNEELQSINEEMETAKEELQVTNEELNTVNDELQHRNAELSEANNDLNNLIGSMDMAYLMLGSDLGIRRFTPAARKMLNLLSTDVGRPIGNIKLNINVPNLAGIIAKVIDTAVAKEQEVQDLEGRWYSMRILPYKTEDNRIAGAVLALVEIDALKRTQESLRESEGALRSLLEQAPDFILSADPEGRVLFLNRTVAGLAKEAAMGESIYDYLAPEDIPVMRKCLSEVRTTGQVAHFETRGIGRLLAMKRYITRVGPIKSGGKTVGLTLMTAETPANKPNQKQGRR